MLPLGSRSGHMPALLRPAPLRPVWTDLARLFLLLCLLQGCSALPTNAPQERDVLNAERSAANSIGFRIVPVEPATLSALSAAPVEDLRALGRLGRSRRADAIGPGDVLAVSVFEVGSSLFGAAAGGAVSPDVAGAGGGPAPGAGRQTLSGLQVDAGGFINFPYVGRVRAAGRTPMELARVIEDGLGSKSQEPQVVVAVTTNLANTVIVSGDVEKPGRVPLTLGRERLLDAIAVAGGAKRADEDTYVQVTRGETTARILLQVLNASPRQDIQLVPGDRVQVLYKPRTFTAFGASQKVEQVPLNAAEVTLAEGIARVGGPDNARADANAVFLFRYEGQAVARQLGLPAQDGGTPVIYKLDMLNPTSYFLATRVPMRDQDVLLMANARTDQISKLFTLVAQATFPILLGRQLAQ